MKYKTLQELLEEQRQAITGGAGATPAVTTTTPKYKTFDELYNEVAATLPTTQPEQVKPGDVPKAQTPTPQNNIVDFQRKQREATIPAVDATKPIEEDSGSKKIKLSVLGSPISIEVSKPIYDAIDKISKQFGDVFGEFLSDGLKTDNEKLQGAADVVSAGALGALSGATNIATGMGTVSDVFTPKKQRAESVGNLFLDAVSGSTESAFAEIQQRPTSWLQGHAVNLSQTLGNMVPSIILASTGGPTIGRAAFGIGAGQAAFEQAAAEGKTYWESLTYGIYTGVLETTLQSVLGGIAPFAKGGTSVLSRTIQKPVSALLGAIKKNASSPFLQALTKVVVKGASSATAEAVEESLQEFLGNAYRKVIFKEDGKLNEGMLTAAVYGFLMAGIMNAGQYSQNYKVAKTETIVAEAQKIAEQAEKILESAEQQSNTQDADTAGVLETDRQATTEETVNERENRQYAELSPAQQAAYSEFLNNGGYDTYLESDPDNVTVIEYMRDKGLLEQAAEPIPTFAEMFETEKAKIEQGETAQQAVAQEPMAQEQTQAQETMQAPMFAQKETLTEDELSVVEIGKKLNIDVVVTETLPNNTSGMRGQDGRLYIASGKDNAYYVFGHELTHSLESAENKQAYNRLARFITDEVIGRDNVKALVADKVAEYKASGIELTDGQARTEIYAQKASELLFTDKAAIDNLVRTDRTLAQKVFDFLKRLATSVAGTKEAKRVRQAADLYRQALKATTTTTAVDRAQFSMERIDQRITSAGTSLNQIPAIFNAVKFDRGTINLDIGGGKYDKATEFMASKGVDNLVYDRFNRPAVHNEGVLKKVVGNGGADTVTVSNVLNVIQEAWARNAVIREAKKYLKPNGTAYFTFYEGNKSGVGEETKRGYQNNRVSEDYIAEIASVFGDVTKKGKVIIAKNRVTEQYAVPRDNSTEAVARRKASREAKAEKRRKHQEWLASRTPSQVLATDVANQGTYIYNQTRKEVFDEVNGLYEQILQELSDDVFVREVDITEERSETGLELARKIGEIIAPHTYMEITDDAIGESESLSNLEVGRWHITDRDYRDLKRRFGNLQKAGIIFKLKALGISYDRSGGQSTDLVAEAIQRIFPNAFSGERGVTVEADEIVDFLLKNRADGTGQVTEIPYAPTEEAAREFGEDYKEYYYDLAVDKLLESSAELKSELERIRGKEVEIIPETEEQQQPEATPEIAEDDVTPDNLKALFRQISGNQEINSTVDAFLAELSKDADMTLDKARKAIIKRIAEVGEKKPESNVPAYGKNDMPVRSFWATVNKDIKDDVFNAIVSDTASNNVLATYEPTTNAATESWARETIDGMGDLDIIGVYNKIVRGERFRIPGQKGVVKGEQKIAFMESLLIEAQNAGETRAAISIIADLSALATDYGRAIQMLAHFKRMTGASQVAMAEKFVERLNTVTFKKRIANKRDKMQRIEIPENLRERLMMAKNEAEREEVFKELQQDIADQIPASWADKLVAWRYLAMLANLKTHNRNIIGNTGFVPATMYKDLIKLGIETTAKKMQDIGVLKFEVERTTAIRSDKALLEWARGEAEARVGELQSGGKYNPATELQDMRTIFRTRALEMLRKGNNFALEWQDGLALKFHYRNTLARGLTANNFTVDEINSLRQMQRVKPQRDADGKIIKSEKQKRRDMLERMEQRAFDEALRNTYRDMSDAATAIVNFGKINKVAQVAVSSVMPFTKVPINITKRGLEYSPVGLAIGVKDVVKILNAQRAAEGIFSEAMAGNKSVAEVIDELASGIAGTTALTAVGLMLGWLGVAMVGGGDDRNEERLMRENGEMNYSIKIGKWRASVDWFQPLAMPLFVGVTLADMFKERNFSFKGLWDSVWSIANPIYDTTFLQGVKNIFEGVKYSESEEVVADVAKLTVQGYLNQFVPTLFGQLTRTIEKERKTARTSDASAMPDDIQYFLQKMSNKIPGANQLLPSSASGQVALDIWGQPIPNKETVAARAFSNFLNPAYVQKAKDDPLLNAMIVLNSSTDAASVMPTIPGKTLTYKNNKYSLSAEQQTDLRMTVGEAQRKAAEAFVLKGQTVRKNYERASTREDDPVKRYAWYNISFDKVDNKSKGKYTDDDLRAKVLDDVMQSAYEQAVSAWYEANKNNLAPKK